MVIIDIPLHRGAGCSETSSDLLKDMEGEKDSEEIQAQCSACRDGVPAPTASSSGVQRTVLCRPQSLSKILQTSKMYGAAVVDAGPGPRARLIFLGPWGLEEHLGVLRVHRTQSRRSVALGACSCLWKGKGVTQ